MLDLINVSYDTQIPNNVGLSQDKRVLKALEKWQRRCEKKGRDDEGRGTPALLSLDVLTTGEETGS